MFLFANKDKKEVILTRLWNIYKQSLYITLLPCHLSKMIERFLIDYMTDDKYYIV